MKSGVLLSAVLATAVTISLAYGDDSPPGASDPAPRQVSITTVSDEQITAPLVDLSDGALRLDSKPPRSVSLLDLQKLTFTATGKLSAEWIGQDQHDLVRNGSRSEGNGIQDVHLRLIGLSEKKIKQLKLAVRSPARTWKMEPSSPSEWKLALQRTGSSSDADVFIEPTAVDLFAHTLRLTLTYADDSAETFSCEARTHTNNQAKFEAAPAKGGIAPSELAVIAHLEAGDLLHGKLIGLTEETLALKTAWQDKLEVPLLGVEGLLFDRAKPDAGDRYLQARGRPGADDLFFVTAKDGKPAEISGRLKQFDGRELHIVYEGTVHAIPAERLQAIVFAAHPSKRSAAAACQIVRLVSGDVLSGKWQGLSDTAMTLDVPWAVPLKIPLDSISEIQTRNGNLVALSDMRPISVEETPYFGRSMAHHTDESLEGGPLHMKGRTYAKGLAVHSRCKLTYALDDQFAKFKTQVGFDDSAGDKGRVVCRVLADGNELFAKPDMLASEDPQSLELSVVGAKQLSLEIDFGADQDVGDRVIWAEPRLFRK